MKPYLIILFLLAAVSTHLSAQKFEPRGDKRNEIGIKILSMEGPTGFFNYFYVIPRLQAVNGITYRRYFKNMAFYSGIAGHSSTMLTNEDYICWDCPQADFYFKNMSLRFGAEKFFKLGRFQPFFALGLGGTASKNRLYIAGEVAYAGQPRKQTAVSQELNIEGNVGTRFYFSPIFSAQIQAGWGYGWQNAHVWEGSIRSAGNEKQYTNSGFITYPSLSYSANIAF